MIQVQLRKWGNSLGLRLPHDAVERYLLKPNEEISIEIKSKTNVLKELFVSGLKFKKPTSQILKEARIELESKL